ASRLFLSEIYQILASRPQTLQRPSSPITPMHAPSGQSRRSANSDSPSASASDSVSVSVSVSASASASVSDSDSVPEASALRPHPLHRPSSPMTPMHAPSGQSCRSSRFSSSISSSLISPPLARCSAAPRRLPTAFGRGAPRQRRFLALPLARSFELLEQRVEL